MTNIIQFVNSDVVPAYMQADVALARKANAALTAHAGGTFGVMSIKGKRFSTVVGKVTTVLKRSDDPAENASYIDVILLAVNPNKSKIFYETDYEEGANAKPDCYSNSGDKPAADAAKPQCKTCALCEHNVWGSGKNGVGTRCSSSIRMAIAMPNDLQNPLLLRAPAGSIKNVAAYGRVLDTRGAVVFGVGTRIRFDQDEASPKLKFEYLGMVPQSMYTEAKAAASSYEVKEIIGTADSDLMVFDAAAALPAPTVEDTQLEAALAPAKVAIAKAAVVAPKVEAPAPAPQVEAPAPAPKKEAVAKAKPATIVDDLDALLSDLDD